MPGFDSGSVLYALNVDFTGNSLTSGSAQVTQDGQLLIGSSTAPNIRVGTLTAGSGVSIANAHGSITISAGASVPLAFAGNSGTAAPVANTINILGTGSLTTSASGSSVTTSLTGLTNHAVQVGAGTATLTQVGPTATTGAVLQNNSGADPSYSSASYPSSTTINQILYSSSANTVAGLATVNSAALATTSAGVPQWLALTDGQILIGSTAGQPAAATITAGAGISVTNAGNSITIASADQGFTWNNTTGTSATLLKENGYQSNNAGLVTFTLPTTASSTFGDTIKIMGLGAGGWTIAQLAGQQIQFGSSGTTVGVGGSLSSTNRYNSLEIVYTTTSGLWSVQSSIGNLTVV